MPKLATAALTTLLVLPVTGAGPDVAGTDDFSTDVLSTDVLNTDVLTTDLCAECPCPEDLDRDGQVGFADLLRLLAGWGRCLDRYTCDVPNTCEGGGSVCNDSPLCVCFELFDGTNFCVDLLAQCDDMPICPDGDCPPGHVCIINSCCGETRCISLEWACLPGAMEAAPLAAPGARTVTGVVRADRSANRGPCELCFCPEDVDRDGAAGVPDLLRILSGWGACEALFGRR